ncbi:carboxymuconolactone decarboxylase family protein [Kitasatospora kifunensis]|uniref:AhpD family alkylhydroperoxidase n=1 Tax=Kitasatospora kifunensis TaxID=58351 RepID=A0A7W7QZ19_KITKI|nr:carboxymuconolactone decarboxylase family protein [Kitasatospora kifunensis]MBB4922447.1 AhpD family alkylhydroperoxidase [Kitasatospora kifunensis]
MYHELERDFGVLAPPIALHSPAPDALAASWLMLRETLLVPGAASRAAKEAVASAVSAGNECPFCVRMHTATLHGLAHGRDSAAIAEGRLQAVADPAVRAVALWATRAAVRDTAARNPLPAPPEQLPELLGTAVVLHYLNRMVNVFLGAVPLPPGAPERSLRPVLRVLTWLIKSAARSGPMAGASLGLLPTAPLPDDLAWTAGNPAIAAAFARATGALEQAALRSVPDGVRALLPESLARWDGRPPGFGRGWVEQAIAPLPAVERAAGRLALLTALASYTVDESVIGAFRAQRGEDEALVELTAWASLMAARQVGAWTRHTD